MWFNGIKIAVFSKKLTKNRPTGGGFAPRRPKPLAAGGSTSRPPSVLRLRYTTFLNTSPKLDICTFQLLLKALSLCKILLNCQQATISDLPSYNIFVPQKVPLLKIFDDVIACNLWFGPPYQSKILASPTNWRLLEKLFWRSFFWRTLAAVSLVLGLGLEHSCSWPREGLSSNRLSLALVSDFFVSLIFDFFCPWPRIFLCPWPRVLCPQLHYCEVA